MKISKNWTSGRRKTEHVEAELRYIGVSDYYAGTPNAVDSKELCFRIIENLPTPENRRVLKLRLTESEAKELLEQLQTALIEQTRENDVNQYNQDSKRFNEIYSKLKK